MLLSHQHLCLAIDRSGLPCNRQPQCRDLDRSRSGKKVQNANFCSDHASEYQLLIKRYTRARLRCQKARWLFNTSSDDLNDYNLSALEVLKRSLERALESLTLALDIRILRCQRFAAAYDEFANDETVETLLALKEHCFKLFEQCLRIAPVSTTSSFWQRILSMLMPLLCWYRGDKREVPLPLSRPSAVELVHNDIARKYYGPFGASLRFVLHAQNAPPTKVSHQIRDPINAMNVARKMTFRSRLSSFMTTDDMLINELGLPLLLDIQNALYCRSISKDPILFSKSYGKTCTLAEFFDDRCVNASDLERIWTDMYHINPAILRDALIDLEDINPAGPLRQILDFTIPVNIASTALSLQGWETLFTILDDTLSFCDLFFLSTSARELIDMAIYTAFHHSRYTNCLTQGETGTDSLLLCMRALGFLVTWSGSLQGHGSIIGIMADTKTTRRFFRLMTKVSEVRVFIKLSNGTIYKTDAFLDDAQSEKTTSRRKNNQDPIRVNLATSDGEAIDSLHHRSGECFPDGCELRIAAGSQDEEDKNTWKLMVLQCLTEAKCGHRDVCKALDAVLLDVEQRSIAVKSRLKARVIQYPQINVLQKLKDHYSTVSLLSNIGHTNVRHTSAGPQRPVVKRVPVPPPPVPSKTSLLKSVSRSDSSSFESCSDDDEIDTPISSVDPFLSTTPRKVSAQSKNTVQSMKSIIPEAKQVASESNAEAASETKEQENKEKSSTLPISEDVS